MGFMVAPDPYTRERRVGFPNHLSHGGRVGRRCSFSRCEARAACEPSARAEISRILSASMNEATRARRGSRALPVVLAMLAGFLGACPRQVDSPEVPAPEPEPGPRWQSATFTLAGRTLELPLALSPPRSIGPSHTVLFLLDDLLYADEDPQAVVPAAWVESATVVVLPLSRLITAGQPMGQALLAGQVQVVHELGAQLRARGGGPVVLVANSLATMIGARAVGRESTPFAGYVGAGQLTSFAAGRAWLRATGPRARQRGRQCSAAQLAPGGPQLRGQRCRTRRAAASRGLRCMSGRSRRPRSLRLPGRHPREAARRVR